MSRGALLCLALAAAGAAGQPHPGHVGSATCGRCHAEQFAQWRGSHHWLAMREARPGAVLGDFDSARFRHAGVESRFHRDGERHLVTTDDAAGEPRTFEVAYAFGARPLQQYLLRLPGGRLNALGIAWDSRAARRGGQRWFHLYPEAAGETGGALHWSGHLHNWNSRCAECHSTDLQKRYDPAADRYASSFAEPNVACEACHGPGGAHLALAERGALGKGGDTGLAVDLARRGRWRFRGGAPIAENPRAGEAGQQVHACGRCHSRRGALGRYRHNRELLDTHRLSLLEAGLYYPDGQIRDEVYVHGSFLQSGMHRAGVVCSDCHDPHSGAPRLPGNSLCAQCHRADVYDAPRHHHHASGGAGAVCANCHMPETVYMRVDPRRDHSLRVPRPDLSVALGTPNACNQCHGGRDAHWALAAMRGWGVAFADSQRHPARDMALAWRGDRRAFAGLERSVRDPEAADIWRASALAALGQFAEPRTAQLALPLLRSPRPLLRMAAARTLEFLPPARRLRALAPNLADPTRAVRMEVARLLAGAPTAGLDAGTRAAMARLRREYLEVLRMDADTPEAQSQLGLLHGAEGDWERAERAYRRALRIEPRFVPALLNLADLYRAPRREDEARELLERAIAAAPEQGAPHYALGLLEIRAGRRALALAPLRKAARLERSGSRHRHTYAIALHDSGDAAAAIGELRALHRELPGNPEPLATLIGYLREGGELREALAHAERLRELLPGDPRAERLYRELAGGRDSRGE